MHVRVAVVGVGHLGKEHARILSTMPGVTLAGVADVNLAQAEAVARRCDTTPYADYQTLLELADAAVIAVPTFAHHDVASDFLRRGIPLLVEKPLASTLQQAEALVRLSAESDVLLQVGHIERFNPAFVELESRRLQPKFIDAARLTPFSGRSTDVGVVLDLMIHDLDAILALVQAPVAHVDALGVSLFGPHEDIANARLTFANGCVANVSASRANATPLRQMRVLAPEGFVSLDFHRRRLSVVQPSALMRHMGFPRQRLDSAAAAQLKEKLYDQFLQTHTMDFRQVDQLTAELSHFVECVRQRRQPKVPGEAGRDAIALATRILDKIRAHRWEGTPAGPVGPQDLPAAVGPIFGLSEAA
jgi:predicted dehydrogenase